MIGNSGARESARYSINWVVRESLRERVMFKQRLKGMKELSNVDVWRRVFQAENKCKGPGAGVCLMPCGNSKEAVWLGRRGECRR